MKTKISLLSGVVAIIAFIGLWSSAFIVHETQQALVVEFGKLKRVIKDPGLYLKIPYIQNVLYYDDRLLDFDYDTARGSGQGNELTLGDGKRVIVDLVARYKIEDPLVYYKTFGDEFKFRSRMEEKINADLRDILGRYGLSDILSDRRKVIMQQIGVLLNNQMKGNGIKVVDVLIKRADLPKQNTNAILLRMQKERERIAIQFRAEGEKTAAEIRARADKRKEIILANANKESEILRGLGDGTAAQIYNMAFSLDKQFYEFYQSMEAYKKSFADGETKLVLSPKSDFFKYFGNLDQATTNSNVPLSKVDGRINDIDSLIKIQNEEDAQDDLNENNADSIVIEE